MIASIQALHFHSEYAIRYHYMAQQSEQQLVLAFAASELCHFFGAAVAKCQ